MKTNMEFHDFTQVELPGATFEEGAIEVETLVRRMALHRPG